MSALENRMFGDLRQVALLGLFGQRNVQFTTASEGPTLLYGQNGTGKSTILRLINDVAHGRWLSVLEGPFTEMGLTFSSGSTLTLERRNDELIVVLDNTTWLADRESIRRARRRQAMRNRHLEETGRVVAYAQAELFKDTEVGSLPPWVEQVPQRFPVLLIEDQRLVVAAHTTRARSSDAGPAAHSAVGRLPARLTQEIQFAFSLFGSNSQELDRHFPMKLVEAIDQQEAHQESDAAVHELRELLERVRTEREALERVGLLGGDEPSVSFNRHRLETPRARPVIRAYAENTLAKFSILSDIRVRLETFTSFLNQHYQGKTVVTNREDGFAVVLDDGTVLPPWKLSSGEQQILALAYRILFASRTGTLVLIDEPELSLHVLWQSTLIEDLAAMGAARGVSFILATHSPTVIGDRVDLMRSLDADIPTTSVAAEDSWPDEELFEIDEDTNELDDEFIELDEESDEPEA